MELAVLLISIGLILVGIASVMNSLIIGSLMSKVEEMENRLRQP